MNTTNTSDGGNRHVETPHGQVEIGPAVWGCVVPYGSRPVDLYPPSGVPHRLGRVWFHDAGDDAGSWEGVYLYGTAEAGDPIVSGYLDDVVRQMAGYWADDHGESNTGPTHPHQNGPATNRADLTDTVIAQFFGAAAVTGGDVVTVTIEAVRARDLGDYDGRNDDPEDELLSDVLDDLRTAADGGGLPCDQDGSGSHLGSDGSWSDPDLYVDRASMRLADDGAVEVEAAAWAADWVDGDFKDERSGRRVTLRVVSRDTQPT